MLPRGVSGDSPACFEFLNPGYNIKVQKGSSYGFTHDRTPLTTNS
jgi:hypothetical protein